MSTQETPLRSETGDGPGVVALSLLLAVAGSLIYLLLILAALKFGMY